MEINDENINTLVQRYVYDDDRTFGEIGQWDVSNVTDMSRLFQDMKDFNEDISMWNVSNVNYMKFMFNGATSFNQPLEK